jgi:hypothetical protein
MAQRPRSRPNKRQGRTLAAATLRKAPPVYERVAPVVYGEKFIVLEDEKKDTFVFEGGAWVAYATSIAECRKTCQVKELPQRVGRKIRYEVRCPNGQAE